MKKREAVLQVWVFSRVPSGDKLVRKSSAGPSPSDKRSKRNLLARAIGVPVFQRIDFPVGGRRPIISGSAVEKRG